MSGFGPCSTCSTTLRALRAAQPPIDTWSSVAALVDSESIEEGWQSTLFSETADRNASVLVNGQHDFSTVVKIKLSSIWLRRVILS